MRILNDDKYGAHRYYKPIVRADIVKRRNAKMYVKVDKWQYSTLKEWGCLALENVSPYRNWGETWHIGAITVMQMQRYAVAGNEPDACGVTLYQSGNRLGLDGTMARPTKGCPGGQSYYHAVGRTVDESDVGR